MPGFNQRKNGPINREVCWLDRTLVDPMKIAVIQMRTGSQAWTLTVFGSMPVKKPARLKLGNANRLISTMFSGNQRAAL